MNDTTAAALADESLIESDPDVLSGAPVFAGTLVPVQAFLDALEGGWSIEEFLERNPGVRREQLIDVLRLGTRALLAQSGHTLGGGGAPVARDKAEVLSRLSRASGKIRALGVRRLSLFGSFVRGEQRSGSDIDLIVEFQEGQKTFDNFMELTFLLEEVLGRKVQLVTRDSLSPYLGPHILDEAEHVPLAT
jgi:uncharacterized protein